MRRIINWEEYFLTLDYTANGDKIPYNPRENNRAQFDFHSNDCQYRAMFGGSGLGKSMAAARDAELSLIDNTVSLICWIVSPKYVLAEKEFKYIWEDMVVKQKLQPESHRYNVRSGDLYIKFPWGTEVVGKSEEASDTLLGDKVDILILGEGSRLKKDTYDRFLRRAVARAEGIVICNTTPAGMNWVYDTFYLPFLKGDPKYWSGIYDVLDNSFYSREEYDSAKKDLPPEIFQEQFQGKFVHYTGLLYPEFDRKWHLWPIDIANLSKQFPLTCLIDIHPTKPTAVLWSLTDRDNCTIFGDELWMHGLISDVCESIYQKSKQHKREPQYFVIDTIDKEDVRTGINCLSEYRKELERFFKHKVHVKVGNRSAKQNEQAHIMKIREKFKGNCQYGSYNQLKKPFITVGNHMKQTIFELEHACWDADLRTAKSENNHFLDLIKEYFAENPTYDTKTKTQIYNYRTGKYREMGQQGSVNHGISATQ